MPEMHGEQSIIIPAPIDKVYAYVSDFERHIEWNHQPTSMTKLTDGAIAVGTRFRTVEQLSSTTNWFMAKIMFPILGRLMGMKGYTEAEITAMVPNDRIEWKASAPGRNGDMMRAEWVIRFEDVDNGTKVSQRFHFIPQHPMTERATSASMQQDISDEVAHNLEKLKSILAS